MIVWMGAAKVTRWCYQATSLATLKAVCTLLFDEQDDMDDSDDDDHRWCQWWWLWHGWWQWWWWWWMMTWIAVVFGAEVGGDVLLSIQPSFHLYKNIMFMIVIMIMTKVMIMFLVIVVISYSPLSPIDIYMFSRLSPTLTHEKSNPQRLIHLIFNASDANLTTSVSKPWLSEAGAHPRSTSVIGQLHNCVSSSWSWSQSLSTSSWRETFCLLVDCLKASVPRVQRVTLALLHCTLVLSSAQQWSILPSSSSPLPS